MNKVWVRKDELAVVESADRVVVLDLDRLDEPPLVLTDSATAVWSAIDGSRDEEGICAEVAGAFEVDTDRVRHHVLEFLGDLADRHLIISA